MTEKNPTRPPQVTMAGWVTILGSVFVVIGHFETVANLRTIETRERVARMLKDPPMSGWGASVDEWLSLLHVVSLVGAASAAAAAILGAWVLRRNHGARLGLSVLAVPLLVTGFLTSGFLSILVAISVVMLWGRQGRDWFAGKSWVPPTLPERKPPEVKRPETAAQPPVETPAPPAYDPDLPAPLPWEQGAARPHVGFGVPQPPAPAAVRRPVALVWACVLTWVFASLVALVFGYALIAVFAAPDVFANDPSVRQVLEDADMTFADVRPAMILTFVVLGLWALASALLAVFAFLGQDWARVLLVVSSSGAGAILLIGLLTSGVAGALFLPVLASAVATTVLLLRAEVTAWFRARRSR